MFKKIFCIFFVVLLFVKTQAQFLDKNYYLVDSLQKTASNKNDFLIIDENLKLIRTAISDTTKLALLNQIVENCNDETVWPKYNRLMYAMASTLYQNEKNQQLKKWYLSSKALAINNYGFYFQNYTQQTDKAISLYREAAKLFKETDNKNGQVTVNNNIANLLYNSGKILEALDIYHETIKLQEELKNKAGLTPLLNNIAETYIFIGDTAKAFIYLKRALSNAIQTGDKRITAQELQNIGVLSSHLGRRNYAVSCLKKAMALREEIGDVSGVSKSKINLATIFLKDKDYSSANRYLTEVEPYVTQSDNLSLKYLFSSVRGQYYIDVDDAKNAEEQLEQGLKYTRASNSVQDEAKIINSLFNLYSRHPNDQKELQLFRRSNEINKIVNGSEIKRSAIRKNYEFEYSKKEQDYKIEQAIKDEKSKSEKRKQKFITVGISAILLLALIFSFFIFNAFKGSKQKNVIISNQKQEVEKQKHLIEEKQKEIVDSINYAKRIQNTLLANEEVINKSISQHFILFKPKDIVSGDFYWANSVVTENANLFFLAVCDSTGHGVPGAFMSLLNTNFLNEAINEKRIYEPNKVFNYVRMRLINSISKESQKDGFDGILVCLDKSTQKISYSAANNSPILVSQNKNLNKLKCDKMPVGKGEINTDFNLYELDYKTGDMLYLYTDGYADQFGGPSGKKYKYKPLNELLVSISDVPLNRQVEVLDNAFQNWKGDLEQVDDVCIIGVKL